MGKPPLQEKKTPDRLKRIESQINKLMKVVGELDEANAARDKSSVRYRCRTLAQIMRLQNENSNSKIMINPLTMTRIEEAENKSPRGEDEN